MSDPLLIARQPTGLPPPLPALSPRENFFKEEKEEKEEGGSLETGGSLACVHEEASHGRGEEGGRGEVEGGGPPRGNRKKKELLSCESFLQSQQKKKLSSFPSSKLSFCCGGDFLSVSISA